eukprot:CAMPEP_0195019268 /NCGR_PEP_ID=MMETSP0326_2-20130528/32391_1 /TAXON_ID=2866 ORGANISM="Crypthecodinium cohnii, Strain Seligo" /NCGR_SAMPLE_ID=MMETSP0326_2 /ASSEMBLY_ACC=CAM_ASM_000348 /LENGTH=108 /DNA_ID=CAMNT_0040037225 /DNA_START=321 /DNA_END=643 /DNA_ORIENTATION=-
MALQRLASADRQVLQAYRTHRLVEFVSLELLSHSLQVIFCIFVHGGACVPVPASPALVEAIATQIAKHSERVQDQHASSGDENEEKAGANTAEHENNEAHGGDIFPIG